MKTNTDFPISPLQMQAVATLAARRAGEHVISNLHRRGDFTSNRRSDVKHKLDVEAQECAEAVIREIFPEHDILGEESRDKPLANTEWLWIIDPIDGTINFFHGLPWWCCSVAARFKGRTVAGAVYMPEMGMTFEATRDGPSLCNGAPIHVSQTRDLSLAILATGADRWDPEKPAFRFMKKISDLAQRPRVSGSAALDLCMVACGRVDGYFESGIYTWDIAAGALIVARAGGKCESLRRYSKHRMAFLATNSQLFQECRDALLPMLAE